MPGPLISILQPGRETKRAGRGSMVEALAREKDCFFSVIIPTYNRPEKMAQCLAALSRLSFPRVRFEVIVIDDGGGSALEPVLDPFAAGLNLTLLTQAHGGPAAARNRGVKRAKGDFLVFIDDDCEPSRDWLKNLSLRCIETPERAIGGKTMNGLPENPYSAASQAILDVVYSYYNADPGQASFFASNNLTMPRRLFQAIGGFDEAFLTSEDRDLCDRWKQQGFRMTFAPEVLLHHSHDLTLRSFWRQHFNYGRGAYRHHRAIAGRGTGHFRPDLKFYCSLFRYPFSKGRHGLGMMVLLVLSQVANALGFFYQGLPKRGRNRNSRSDQVNARKEP